MDAIGQRLDALLATRDAASTRRRDPVDFVHRYQDPRDQEIVGLVGASLAFGNAVAARQSIDRALAVLGPRPAQTVSNEGRSKLERRFAGFVHRIYRGRHLASVLHQAGMLLDAHGSLGEAFVSERRRAEGDFREGLGRFADRLRGNATDRSTRHLVSDPRAGSACKRLLLYLRWMVRPADGVDLGLWSVAPADLVMPVDTHVHRISLNLGLTSRRTASWSAAEDITTALRRFDPADPVKYDFALCHLGVSRDCPSRPEADKCARCVLHDVCSVWTDGRVARSA